MDWPIVLRELHLEGGIRILNGTNPTAEFRHHAISGKRIEIRLDSFSSYYRNVRELGLKIIGCDFFTYEDEVTELQPPQWRSKNLTNQSWLCNDQANTWSFIAHSAFNKKSGLICDISTRISHQIKSCEWRLRQLSEVYAQQLNSRIKREKFVTNSQFLDGYTSLCYLALQAFLVDACVLRDYLSEFYAEVTIQTDSSNQKKINTLSGLLRKWKAHPPTDSAGKELRAAAQENQWLFELGAYRDLIIHTAPLANAGKNLFAMTKTLSLPGGELLPAVKLPLPNNPGKLKKERDTGLYFQDPELSFATFKNTLEADVETRDSLQYAHLCMQLLGVTANSISKITPFPPEIPTFNHENIIGDVKLSWK